MKKKKKEKEKEEKKEKEKRQQKRKKKIKRATLGSQAISCEEEGVDIMTHC